MSGWMCRAPKLMTGSGVATSTQSRVSVVTILLPPANSKVPRVKEKIAPGKPEGAAQRALRKL